MENVKALAILFSVSCTVGAFALGLAAMSWAGFWFTGSALTAFMFYSILIGLPCGCIATCTWIGGRNNG